MKKVIFRNVLVALVLTLGFLMGSSIESNAQVLSTNPDPAAMLYLPPTGDFVDSDDAKGKLLAELESYKPLMSTLSQQAAAALMVKVEYYNGIYNALEAGKDVPSAIIDGLSAISGDSTINPASPGTMNSLKEEAIDLLDV